MPLDLRQGSSKEAMVPSRDDFERVSSNVSTTQERGLINSTVNNNVSFTAQSIYNVHQEIDTEVQSDFNYSYFQDPEVFASENFDPNNGSFRFLTGEDFEEELNKFGNIDFVGWCLAEWLKTDETLFTEDEQRGMKSKMATNNGDMETGVELKGLKKAIRDAEKNGHKKALELLKRLEKEKLDVEIKGYKEDLEILNRLFKNVYEKCLFVCKEIKNKQGWENA